MPKLFLWMDKQKQLAKVVRSPSSPVPLELARTLTLALQGSEPGPG